LLLKGFDNRRHHVAEACQGLGINLIHNAKAHACKVDRVGITKALEASLRDLAGGTSAIRSALRAPADRT
jgi:hypothetical protein